MSTAMVLTAGSNSSGCGASTPTKRSSEPVVPAVRRDDSGNSALLAQPNHHIDPGDLVALGDFGHLLQHQMRVGNIDQLVIVFEIEMMMRRHVGVEIGLGAVNADLT